MSGPERLARTLRRRFTTLVAHPDAYERRVLDECAPFPEGDLLPFVFPMMGFSSAIAREPALRGDLVPPATSLAESAVRSVTLRFCPPNERLEDLESYEHEGVYLGQLAMALAFFRLMGGDGRFEPLRAHLVRLLRQALDQTGAEPLDSFPGISWPFDTVPPVLALHLDDRITGTSGHAAVVAAHLQWMRGAGTEPATHLPWAHLGHRGAPQPPRGCDLGYRIPLLALIDRPYAREMYAHFCRSHWLERGVAAGFAEWPGGLPLGADADSGPILFGIGLAATGFGIAAAHVAQDGWRTWRLLSQLAGARGILALARPLVRTEYAFDRRYITGTLMGDASLFGTIALEVPARCEPR